MCFYTCVNRFDKVPFVLAAAAAVAVGSPKEVAGQPVQSFSKEILRVGKFVHPATGQEFEFTHADLKHFETQFSRMADAGVKVYVPADHTRDPEKNRGFSTAMSVQGDRLVAKIDLIGKDAIQLAASTDVSVRICDVKDSSGNTFPQAIEHIALVVDPVITKLAPFAIELSRAKTLNLANGDPMEYLKKMAAELGVNIEGLDEAAIWTACQAAMAKLKGGDMAKKDEELKAAKTELSRAQEQVKALELAAKKPEMDADTLALHQENNTLKLSRLVEEGKITPATRTKLEKNLGLKGDKTAALVLSKTAGKAAGFEDAIASLVIDALNEQPAVTKSKSISLSRGGDGKSSAADNAKKLMESRRKNKAK